VYLAERGEIEAFISQMPLCEKLLEQNWSSSSYLALGVSFTMDIMIIMCWCIWKERNAWLFNGEDPSIDKCVATFKREFTMVIIHRAKDSKSEEMKSWQCNIV
jgi:hypothetical protein